MRTLGGVPLLVGAAVALPEDELRAVGGVEVWIVEAFAGGWVDKLAAGGLPLLVGAAVAGPPLDRCAVAEVSAGDVEAAAVDRECAVAVDGPVLGGGETV